MNTRGLQPTVILPQPETVRQLAQIYQEASARAIRVSFRKTT